MTTSVSVQNLTLKFGSAEVLKNLNLDVEEGEFIVLLGPSGCGKSTLLKSIGGYMAPTEGTISLKGMLYAPLQSLPISPVNASLLFAMLFNLMMFLIALLMWKKQWFIKV